MPEAPSIGILLTTHINSVPNLDEEVKAQWSQVQNQYKRRADLVPVLVKTVKGYMAHENKTLNEVTNARTQVGKIHINKSFLDDPEAMKKYIDLQQKLSSCTFLCIASIISFISYSAFYLDVEPDYLEDGLVLSFIFYFIICIVFAIPINLLRVFFVQLFSRTKNSGGGTVSKSYSSSTSSSTKYSNSSSGDGYSGGGGSSGGGGASGGW